MKTRRRLRHVRYATVNKRARALQESGYINKTGAKETKAGFEAAIYELTTRAYLAILLHQTSLEDFIKQTTEAEILTVLAILLKALVRMR